MARRQKVDKPVRAFSESELSSLYDTIRNLYMRRIKVGKLVLTFEEYVAAFVPEPAREVFMEAAQWLPCSNGYHRWVLTLPSGEPLQMILHMEEQQRVPAPPLPRKLMLQSDAPKDIVDRIMHWAEYGGDTSRDFGRVMAVLRKFNEAGFSRLGIRYYWPTLLALFSESRRFKDEVQGLQDLRSPPRLKPLPLGLQQACKLTAETVSSVRLIPPDIEDPEPGEVTLDVISGQEYVEDFGEFIGVS